MVKILRRHSIGLSGLLRIHLNLRKLIMFLYINSLILVHSMLDVIMLLFRVISINLLTMILIHVFIIHAMLNLTFYHLGTILI